MCEYFYHIVWYLISNSFHFLDVILCVRCKHNRIVREALNTKPPGSDDEIQ